MTTLTTYRASDRRCYEGAMCSDLKREHNHTDALSKRMKKANPAASCTYFPAQGKYLVFVGYKELTGVFHEDIQEALIEAIEILEK